MEEQDPSGPGANYRPDRENIQLKALHGGGSSGAPGDVPSTAVFGMTPAPPAGLLWAEGDFQQRVPWIPNGHLMGLTTPQCPAASASAPASAPASASASALLCC